MEIHPRYEKVKSNCKYEKHSLLFIVWKEGCVVGKLQRAYTVRDEREGNGRDDKILIIPGIYCAVISMFRLYNRSSGNLERVSNLPKSHT